MSQDCVEMTGMKEQLKIMESELEALNRGEGPLFENMYQEFKQILLNSVTVGNMNGNQYPRSKSYVDE